ncbi:MAG TPA: hypothetical protein VFV86_07240 [Nitrososphaeraceae archaeon]|nr:hypothetical protein [Nitrososphaeraceae archaeon]
MIDHQNDMELNIWQLYLYSLKSSQTRKKYHGRIDKFFSFVGLEGKTTEEKSIQFIEKARIEGNKWVFNIVLNFMLYQVNRVQNKEIVASTIQNYLKSIKLFCELADMDISWKRISRGLPKGKSYADDRVPTVDEIQKIIEYPDRRIKAIIYTQISSGIRLGSWDYLKWGNIKPIEKNGISVLAAKMIVYAGEDEEYFTFISNEAYLELQKWMRYREKSGEIINENSWVMRDLWDSASLKKGNGLVTKPKKLASSGIKRLIERAIWAQGLRSKLEYGKKRHPFSAVHSFRKWFKTRCEIAGMKPINVEKLLSHSIGISNSYYRPTENDLLEDYLKVVNSLSIDKETQLQTQVNLMGEKNDENSILIKGKLKEKEDQIKELENDMSILKEGMNKIFLLIQNNPVFANAKPEVLSEIIKSNSSD